MSNILIAFKRLVKNPVQNLVAYYSGANRANNMGGALEEYVKDLFCNSFEKSHDEAFSDHQDIFAYLGNQNNPPDAILEKGDAIEVKKIETLGAGLSLNSSYPKDYLYQDSPMITASCRNSDGGNWLKKDIVYIVGVAPKSRLRGIWFVYGDCYAAEANIYERAKNNIISSIQQGTDLELASTNELARINRVDPMGVTYLRVRGMWGIENPRDVFSSLNLSLGDSFFAHVIMRESKYNLFPQEDRDQIEILCENGLINKENTLIRNPNNPALNINAITLSYLL